MGAKDGMPLFLRQSIICIVIFIVLKLLGRGNILGGGISSKIGRLPSSRKESLLIPKILFATAKSLMKSS